LDIYDYLRQFIALDPLHVVSVAVIVGAAVYAIIEGIDAIAKNGQDPPKPGLNPHVKFWGAVALSILIPFGSYVIVTSNDARPLTAGGILLAAGVSFFVATGLHWVLGGGQNAVEAQQVFAGDAVVTPAIPPATPPSA
jgi:hypothetical protein